MEASEIVGWCAAGVCSAALLAYGVWQIWRAAKRRRKPIVITVSQSSDGSIFAHTEAGPERVTVVFEDDAEGLHETARHYWYPTEPEQAIEKTGHYETFKIDFSDLAMGQQSAVVATAGGVEQIRIDMDGGVYVKGEKWGEVKIPEEMSITATPNATRPSKTGR